MAYADKLRSHKKLEIDDMKELINDQVEALNLQQYLDDVEIGNLLFSIAGYNDETKKIYISHDYKKKLKRTLWECFKSDFLALIQCNDNDLYNLYILRILFHEIWHAKQFMETDMNTESLYSKMLSVSFELSDKSGTTYHSLHNKYFHESDAVINSSLMIFKFIREYSLEEKALALYNKIVALEILNCYMKTDYETYGKETNIYTSPTLSMKWIINYLSHCSDTESLQVVDSYRNEYQSDDDIDNLLSSNHVSDDTINMLIAIKKGKIKTTNLFELMGFDRDKNKTIA